MPEEMASLIDRANTHKHKFVIENKYYLEST